MRIYGLILNKRKIATAFVLMVLGISMIFYGATTLYIDAARFSAKISDEEIIKRAENLGMIKIKDHIKNNQENNKEDKGE